MNDDRQIAAESQQMPEQRVKTVNFDVCKKAPKLIHYHSNVPLIITEFISVL